MHLKLTVALLFGFILLLLSSKNSKASNTTAADGITTVSPGMPEGLLDLHILNSNSSLNESCTDLMEALNDQTNLPIGITLNLDNPDAREEFRKILPDVDFDALIAGTIKLLREEIMRLLENWFRPKTLCAELRGKCVDFTKERCITAYYKDRNGCDGPNELCCMHMDIADARCKEHGWNFVCMEMANCKDRGGNGLRGLCGGPPKRICCQLPPVIPEGVLVNSNNTELFSIHVINRTSNDQMTQITMNANCVDVMIIWGIDTNGNKVIIIVIIIDLNHPAARDLFNEALPEIDFDQLKAGNIQLTKDQLKRLLEYLAMQTSPG